MAKPKGRNRSSGRAQPRSSKTTGNAEAENPSGRSSRPSAKEAAAKAVAKPASKASPAKASDKASEKSSEKSSKAAETKASGPKGKPAPTKRTQPSQSNRYTPPIPRSERVSPMWVPIVMFACLGLGMLMIILNYVNVLPGPEPSNVYLVIGLVLITIGFITATRFH